MFSCAVLQLTLTHDDQPLSNPCPTFIQPLSMIGQWRRLRQRGTRRKRQCGGEGHYKAPWRRQLRRRCSQQQSEWRDGRLLLLQLQQQQQEQEQLLLQVAAAVVACSLLQSDICSLIAVATGGDAGGTAASSGDS